MDNLMFGSRSRAAFAELVAIPDTEVAGVAALPPLVHLDAHLSSSRGLVR